MSVTSSPTTWPTHLEPARSRSSRAARARQVDGRRGLRTAARIAVIAITLGFAGLSGILASGSAAFDAGPVMSQSPVVASIEQLAAR